MSVTDDVTPIGVEQARLRPARAVALLVLSRAMIVLVVAALTWAVGVTRPMRADGGMEERPLVLVARPDVAPDGTTVAAMLDGLRTAARREHAEILDVHLVRREGASASVRLTVELPGTDAARVDRLVASLAGGELMDLRPRSVDPTPAGLRITMDAEVELMAVPPDGRVPDERAAAVALAEVAERAGVALRGASIPDRAQDPVRIVASGDLVALGHLVAGIEQEHSAPLRFRELTLRRSAADAYELVLRFVLREDVHRTPSATRP